MAEKPIAVIQFIPADDVEQVRRDMTGVLNKARDEAKYLCDTHDCKLRDDMPPKVQVITEGQVELPNGRIASLEEVGAIAIRFEWLAEGDASKWALLGLPV